MSALILLVLLVGGVLCLGSGLLYLYRYLQARRVRPGAPRLWGGQRRRFLWLAVVGVVLIAGFCAVAWWSAPGHGFSWLPQFMMARQAQSSGPAAMDDGETMPPPQPKVSGAVPPFSHAMETTSSTTTTSTSTTTTSSTTTSTTESTATTSTAPASKPVKTAATATSRDAWTVCAASFRREAVAQNYAQRLAGQGLPARVNQVDLGKRGTWHRVCVGNFATLAEAKGQYKVWEKRGLISDAFLLPLR
ncbi:MAG: SPOR domain-containing protein [Desulfarculaceae bacterium]|nr:SPOR domain-containing protein [Desulfarculaceae bacterium]MCF8046022.1 SPOR domain-containing protein [Desulfarculaceae bacterium]MCF8123054.1 SPOR domain-containing protein [Desulfarculaceae bacterium]